MNESVRYRAAATHLASALIGVATLFVGIGWIEAGGEPAAVPATVIILSLVVLTPIAVHNHWRSRAAFLDTHIHTTCRFLTLVSLAAIVLVGLPAAASWLLPAGSDIWGRVTVLPYLGTLFLTVTWAFLEVRAAVLTMRGSETPYPGWATLAGSIG